MKLRDRWDAFLGRATPGERRALQILEVNRRILGRTRDAAERFLRAVARTADVDCAERGVCVVLPADEWREFAAAVYGEDHPTTVEIEDRIRGAELVHGLAARGSH